MSSQKTIRNSQREEYKTKLENVLTENNRENLKCDISFLSLI